MSAGSSREYPERPISGVGAVIIDPEGHRVVLVRRGAPPLHGQWSLPGGVVELGETLRAACEREALEETGLIVVAGELLEIFDRIIRDDSGRIRYHYVLADFLCQVQGGKLRAGGDAANAEWASAHELTKFNLEKPSIALIKKAFKRIND